MSYELQSRATEQRSVQQSSSPHSLCRQSGRVVSFLTCSCHGDKHKEKQVDMLVVKAEADVTILLFNDLILTLI